MKKVLCVIAVLCAVFASLPASAMTAEEFREICRLGSVEYLKAALKEENLSPNSSLPFDEMPMGLPMLMIAADLGNVDIVKALLDMGADVNISLGGFTTLMCVAIEDKPNAQIMDALIKAGANPADVKNAKAIYQKVFGNTLAASQSATAAARASTIISDMRGLKSACLMYYADHMDEEYSTMVGRLIGSDPFADDALGEYLDDPDKFRSGGSVSVTFKEADGKWWICYAVENDSKVREKLIGKARADGLYKSMDSSGGDYDGGDIVYMIAR